MKGSRAKSRRAGVLGGMGPEATLVFLEKFYALSRGRREQSRPALLVSIDPAVPDRNEAWRGAGPDPGAAIALMGRSLKQAGADFCVMACITAHGYVESFEEDAGIPLIRMPDIVADALGAAGANGPVGLLATTTTLEMKLFQKAFAARNSLLMVPDEKEQETLMGAIYAIKKGEEDARSSVLGVAKSLVARGAHTLLIGCTDLSVLSPLHLWGCTVVDALDLLAKRTLAEIEKKADAT